jgi:branched-chain amino acid transport system substrate-binding protein
MYRPLARRQPTGPGAQSIAAEPPRTHMLAQLVELTGPLAEAGDAWRNGAELAVQEINAAGGLLGKLLAVTTYDAGSTAAGARYAMQRALEGDPLAVLGPALSETGRGALVPPRPRGTPLILGGNAADLTGAAHPATFRALPSAAATMARLAGWLRGGRVPRLAVLWSGRDPYRSSRDALAHEARGRGIDIVAEWVTESTAPAADVSRLLTANPDLLVVLLPPDKAGHAATEARKQAQRLPLIGEASLVAPTALAAAGAAAEGLCAHVLLPPDADGGFAARYLAANKQPPDELAFAGYLAVGMVKAGLTKAARAEPAALAEALHSLSANRDPMLGDCTWNANGDPDRASRIVEVRDGTLHTLKVLRDGV